MFLASDDANHITGQTEVTWAKWSTGNVSFSDGFSLLRRYVDEEERFSVEQIVAVLKQAELGLPVADLIRQVGISELAGSGNMRVWNRTRSASSSR